MEAVAKAMRDGEISSEEAAHASSVLEQVGPPTSEARPGLGVSKTNGMRFRMIEDAAMTAWVKPKLAGEVKFTEWTSAGEMRHPAFLSLREDKRPEDVVLEKEARSPK